MKINYDDYKVILSKIETEDGIEYLAEYREFEFCCGGGKTANEAVKEARENLEIYVAEMQDLGKEIPEPIQEINYSGKITLRLSKSMHKKAAECAAREGVSLNTFFVEAVSEKVGVNTISPVLRAFSNTVDKFAEAVYYTKPIIDDAFYITKINSQTINQSGYRSVQYKLN